jgi:hypothetical protein
MHFTLSFEHTFDDYLEARKTGYEQDPFLEKKLLALAIRHWMGDVSE